jgi:hypothetical protein
MFSSVVTTVVSLQSACDRPLTKRISVKQVCPHVSLNTLHKIHCHQLRIDHIGMAEYKSVIKGKN